MERIFKRKLKLSLLLTLIILVLPFDARAAGKVFTNPGDANAYIQKEMIRRQLDDLYEEEEIGGQTFLDYGPVRIRTDFNLGQKIALENKLRQTIPTSFPSKTLVNYYTNYSDYDEDKGEYSFHIKVLAEEGAKDQLKKENTFIKSWTEENLKGLGEEEKIKFIHDFIVNKADYYDPLDQKSGSYSIYDASAILFADGGVCQAYTVLFSKMATEAGLDAVFLHTKDLKDDPRGHTWNMVKLDGQWKHIDLTNDDLGHGGISYDYYLVEADKIRSLGLSFDTRQVPQDDIRDEEADRKLDIRRIAGADRVETSINLSKAYRNQADTVILAKGDTYPDALAASSLAGLLKAPILLNMEDSLEEITKNEIHRLGAKKAILIGGENTLGPAIGEDLGLIGLEVNRIAGSNRYETSKLICQAYLDWGGQIDGLIIASGQSFPDALAASPLAATRKMPIILSPSKGLSPEAEDFINENRSENIYILGGSNTLSRSIEDELAYLGMRGQRISGANRYQTALEIAGTFMPGAEEAFLASGESFPDSLVIGGTGVNGPILLSPKSKAPEELLAYTFNLKALTLVGGQASLSQNLVNQITGK